MLPQLVQFEEGLNTYGLLSSVKEHPTVWAPVLVAGKGQPVTATSLIDCFGPQYSDSQMKKEKEADTYTYLCDFIYSVEMKSMQNYLYPS